MSHAPWPSRTHVDLYLGTPFGVPDWGSNPLPGPCPFKQAHPLSHREPLKSPSINTPRTNPLLSCPLTFQPGSSLPAPAQPAHSGLGQPEYTPRIPPRKSHSRLMQPFSCLGLAFRSLPGAGFPPSIQPPISHGSVDLMWGAQLPEDVRKTTLLPLVLARFSSRNLRGLLREAFPGLRLDLVASSVFLPTPALSLRLLLLALSAPPGCRSKKENLMNKRMNKPIIENRN